MGRMPPRLQVAVGLLVALSGVRGVVEYEALWLKALFVLVVLAGLWNAGLGWQRRRVV